MGNIGGAAVAIVAGILGLAIVAVIVSQKANTSTVISSAGTALSGIINAAVSPVAGGSTNLFGSGR
jgi:PRD1 phage membrane DNA delivery